MSMTTDVGNFFQTDTSLAEGDRKQRKAANTLGQPVKFPTKLLAIGSDPNIGPEGDTVVVAEAGGLVSVLRLSNSQISSLPPGPKAPVTCLALSPTLGLPSVNSHIIYAGSWDQSIWQYTLKSLSSGGTKVSNSTQVKSFKAHSDFIKCLLVAPTADKQLIVISGGADGEVRLWTTAGQLLATIKPQCRGIECLALDPLSPLDSPTIFFSTSQREVFSFTIPSMTNIKTNQLQLSNPIIAHETSVYRIHFDSDGDLWTASADKTTKHLVRDQNWMVDTTLVHPDFVRDVVVHERYGWVITACRDEEVRVWNRATGDLHHVFTGHFEEVTGLCLVGDLVVSISIDATVRRWSLAPAELAKAVEETKNPQLLAQNPEPSTDLSMLTEEEEAELRALMEEEEADTLEKMVVDS